MFRRFAGVAVALGALLGTGPAVAQAHPLLLQAAPQPGIVAPQSPDAIRLALSEGGVERGSRIHVFGPRGKRVPTSALSVTTSGRTFTVTPRAALPSAVYTVRWSVLGNDGHLVRGTFDFGVAGANGAAPPGAERLEGASAGGRGGEDAVSDGVVAVIGRWLGVITASFLLGAFVLLTVLRRRARDAVPAAESRLRAVAPLAWLLLGLAAVEGVLASATSGAAGELDLGLLTASPTGRADLLRLAVVAVVSAVLLVLRDRDREALRARVLGVGAVVVLGTYAISGHVLSEPSFWTILDQGVHVLTAGLWLGGVIAIVVVTARGGVAAATAIRAFTPVAVGALGVAILTGVLAAIREVDAWYFLRWSDYGRVVLIKSAVVLGVLLLGGVAAWRARRPAGPAEAGGFRLLRVEAVGAIVLVGLAAALSGIVQGRGQPLPAERGSLFAGPAFGTALLADGTGSVTVAPARAGRNVVTLSLAPEAATPKAVKVRLACPCAQGDTEITLRRGTGGVWSAPVDLPDDGNWFGYLTIDGKASTSPVSLAVGVPKARGSEPVRVLAVADLSGPQGDRCRSHVQGVGMALARINGDGGLDGGRKLVPEVLDSGGDAAKARTLTQQALRDLDPVALVGVCGTGADAALDVAGKAGLPAVVGDPSVPLVPGERIFRTAADPYAQGLSVGQVIKDRVQPAAPVGVKTVRALLGDDAISRRFEAGLKRGLAGADARLLRVPSGTLADRDLDGRLSLISQQRNLAFVIDTPAADRADVDALTALGRAREGIVPGPVLFSERVLSERLIRSAGSLGRIGALQGLSEVAPTSADGILYRQSVPLLYRGDLPSLDGLRGYVAGLALRDALTRASLEPGDLVRALRKPSVFSTALLAPWVARQPAAGSPSTLAIQPQFLSPTLIPPAIGGTPQSTAYFPDGTWLATSAALGLSAETGPAPQIGG